MTGNVRSRPGIHVHRTAGLDRRDRTLKGGIPISTPARALVELAAELPTREIERAFDEAVIRRITSRDSVRQARRRATQRGTAALDALLTTTGATRSDAERRLRALLRRSGLPAPEINARVGPYEVDFLWREERLIVEVDGFAFHSARTAFERDRRRDAHLQSLGFRVLRITWRALEYEPELVLVQLAQALVRPVA